MPSEVVSIPMLDRCIDALLRGEDWREGLDAADVQWLAPLMQIAETLIEGDRELPRPGRRERLRLWDRIFWRRQAADAGPQWQAMGQVMSRFTGGKLGPVASHREHGAEDAPGRIPGRRWSWKEA